MERLTIRNSDGSVSQPTDLKWAEALEKLAAYEDTGLEPEEVRPVVYCRDCVHFTAFSVINTDGTGKCGLRGKCSIDCLVDEYDFCSGGERRGVKMGGGDADERARTF